MEPMNYINSPKSTIRSLHIRRGDAWVTVELALLRVFDNGNREWVTRIIEIDDKHGVEYIKGQWTGTFKAMLTRANREFFKIAFDAEEHIVRELGGSSF